MHLRAMELRDVLPHERPRSFSAFVLLGETVLFDRELRANNFEAHFADASFLDRIGFKVLDKTRNFQRVRRSDDVLCVLRSRRLSRDVADCAPINSNVAPRRRTGRQKVVEVGDPGVRYCVQ